MVQLRKVVITTFLVKQLRSSYNYLLSSQCPSLRIFIQLSATLTKLCHIKRDHPVHILCAKCLPSAETHAGIFCHFSQKVRNFQSNFTHLLDVNIHVRLQIFIQLSPTLTKLCHIKCDHPACVSVDGGHFEHIVVVALNMK